MTTNAHRTSFMNHKLPQIREHHIILSLHSRSDHTRCNNSQQCTRIHLADLQLLERAHPAETPPPHVFAIQRRMPVRVYRGRQSDTAHFEYLQTTPFPFYTFARQLHSNQQLPQDLARLRCGPRPLSIEVVKPQGMQCGEHEVFQEPCEVVNPEGEVC